MIANGIDLPVDRRPSEDGVAYLHNQCATRIIGAALEVHRFLGPGLLESIYEAALEHELILLGHDCKRQVAMPVVYKGIELAGAFRIDLLIDGLIVVEVKAVDALIDLHRMQLLSYLRLLDKPLGLLINFNSTQLRTGIRRVVNGLRQ